MLSAARRVLGYQMTIAEWIGTALLLGAPYLAIGLVWTLTHTGDIAHLDPIPHAVAFLARVVSWPLLLISDVCPT
jgi:hypothetical protein